MLITTLRNQILSGVSISNVSAGSQARPLSGLLRIRYLCSPDFWLVLGLVLPLFYLGLGSWAFFDADEGRYAAIPRQMLVHGDFITPMQNQVKFFDKPPLLYWCIAACYRLFGFHEWAARLVPAAAATLGLIMALVLARRMFGKRCGRLAAMVLGTCFLWPVMAHVVVTDLLFSSLLFTAVVFWWLGHSETRELKTELSTAKNRSRLFFHAFWGCLAMAVLAKGPLAVVLAFGVLLSYCLFCRQWRSLKDMCWFSGIALFLILAAPWFVMVALRNPEFNHYFWYDQHIARFFGRSISGADHVTGPDYYFKLFPLVLFPWSFFIPLALWSYRKKLRDRSLFKPEVVFLLCLIGFITLFFNSTSSKLITYILPTVPPFAILLAAFFERQLTRTSFFSRGWSLSGSALAIVLISVAAFAWQKGSRQMMDLNADTSRIGIVCTILLFWALGLLYTVWQRDKRLLLLTTAGGFTGVVISLVPVITIIAPQYTTPSLIAYIQPGLRAPGAELDTVPYTQSVEFYAGQRVEMIGGSSELEYGVDLLPMSERMQWVTDGTAGYDSYDHLRDDLQLTNPVYFFVRKSKKTAKLLMKFDRPHTPNRPIRIIENKRFCVFANRAAAANTPPYPQNISEPFNAWGAR